MIYNISLFKKTKISILKKKMKIAKFKENENIYISDINVFPLLNTKK